MTVSECTQEGEDRATHLIRQTKSILHLSQMILKDASDFAGVRVLDLARRSPVRASQTHSKAL